jgi:type I restriction enzyme R subunit
MKPVVTRPTFTFVQLVDELLRIDDDPQHCEAIAADLLVKFHRRRKRITDEALPDFETAAGMDPAAFTRLLKDRDPSAVRGHFADHPRLAKFLDALAPPKGPGTLISDHPDTVLGIERGYGQGKQPADYLDSFKAYLSRASNEIPALLIVTQRPKELTRAQLKEISLILDEHGYSISHLRSAWRDVSNQDVAASIIGFIRQQALGCPLVPYQERVDRALRAILAKQPWTPPQRKWLERIAAQLKQETIVDKTALDRGQFQAQGGFRRLNKIFNGKLEAVLSDLQEQVWQDAV